MKPSTPKWLLASISFLFVLLALFTLAEILARAMGRNPFLAQGLKIEIVPKGHCFETDEVLGYKNKPGKFTITQNEQLVFSTTHDQNGNRITALKEQDSLHEYWIFGCSFTYGWGVNDWESYPWVLQEDLPQLKVRNFGVGGYGNFQNLLQFEREIETGKKPAYVILAYAPFHDERNVMSKNFMGVLARFNKLGPLSMPFAQLDSKGHLVREAPTPLSYTTWPLARNSAFINSMQQYWIGIKDRDLKGPLVTEAIISEFRSKCEDYDIPFVLAFIGVPDKFNVISERYKRSGIKVIDISVDLSQEWATLLPLDPHPSPQAHRIYADKLNSALQMIAPSDSSE